MTTVVYDKYVRNAFLFYSILCVISHNTYWYQYSNNACVFVQYDAISFYVMSFMLVLLHLFPFTGCFCCCYCSYCFALLHLCRAGEMAFWKMYESRCYWKWEKPMKAFNGWMDSCMGGWVVHVYQILSCKCNLDDIKHSRWFSNLLV